MGRNKGTFNFAANFEVLNKAPLDSRIVVDTIGDLTSPTVWEDSNNNIWLYKGIVVSVVSDPSISNNGLYFLKDDINYDDINSWLKVNSLDNIDASGTSSVTFQLHNGDNGVVLKDASGNLEILEFDGSTYANIKAGHIDINSIKIDTLNGALYAQDGSVFAVNDSFILKGYTGILMGNGATQDFLIDHSLNTIRQTMSIYDGSLMIYPDLSRGENVNVISFSEPPPIGSNYEIVILGF